MVLRLEVLPFVCWTLCAGILAIASYSIHRQSMNMTEYDVVPDSNSGGNMTCESLSHKLSTLNLDDPEDARSLKVANFFYSDRLV
jgi:hypothetical protein